MDELTQLAGRQWVSDKLDSSINSEHLKVSAIEDGKCNRCGSVVTAKLPNGKKYCRACIGLGRICEDDQLIRVLTKDLNFSALKNGGLTWQGKLTKLQQTISDNLVKNFTEKNDTLVHAVTGAGKTEMLFQVISECMRQKMRACIATPRIDVVNELFPRFSQAFSGLKIGKYHGREFKEPENEQLTICTTHQLMKFYQAFDLLVIDEVDSFPYANNAQLHFAAQNAVKPTGVNIYLTATPTADLLEKVKNKQIKLLKLNRRFHGELLPVPKEKLFFRPFLSKKKINSTLVKEILKVIKAGHPLLLFVPRIDEVDDYLSFLKQVEELKKIEIAGVHAQDLKRIEKVQQFRDKKIQFLVTTTILERGVTFKHVWVIVVAADDPIYSTASLVQIAGRVGRAQDDPDGLILYCYHHYTNEIAEAVKQIKEMNQ